MKIAVVSFSEIAKHPTKRMDASYWVGKKNGKKGHKKLERGFLIEDDVNGKEMLTKEDCLEYNKNILELRRLKRKINKLNQKLK
jgi:hypothetical protein